MTTRMALAAFCAVMAGAGPALAELERLQNDFTFRRVGVPGAGATDRITVQIDPNSPHRVRPPPTPYEPAAAGEAAAVMPASAPGPAPAAAPPAGTDWFWNTISPARADSGPGRLEQALLHLASAPEGAGVTRPRMQALSEIAAAHGQDILRATVGTRVSPALVLAVISVESAGRTEAVSGAGAAGLMQLMPATAERFGVTDRLVAAENIRGGVAYLDWLMGHFDGDPDSRAGRLQCGRGLRPRQRWRAALRRDARLCAQGAGRLERRARIMPDAARTDVGWLRVTVNDL